MVKPRTGRRMVLITVHFPPEMLSEIDKWVRRGKFPNRSELIRFAVYRLLHELRLEGSGELVTAM